MSTSDTGYEKQLSEIIQGELSDLYGCSGYKSIMQTMVKIYGRKEEEIITATDGRKCVEIYKRETNIHKSNNYFDVIILDQKMPFMAGLQAAIEIPNINPHQKIIFASWYIEKTLLEALTKLNRAIAVIEKPFALDVLEHMINNTEIFDKLEKITMNQEEKETSRKVSEIMTALQNQI